MNPFESIQNVVGQFSPQQRQQWMGARQTPQMTQQQNQQQMMGLGQHVASPAQQQAQAAPQTGMFAKFNNHLQDNKSAMMAMASGMMGSPGRPGSIGQGFQNYAAGGQLDEQRRDKAQNKNATHDWLKKNGHSDEDIAFFQANPQVMAQALKPKTADATTGMKEYNLAQQQGFDGTFLDYKTGLAESGASNINFNDTQAKAAGFADRATAAERILSGLESEGLKTGAKLKGDLPFGIGNYFQTDEHQQFDQARRDFVNATLRRESGAVISPNEFENAEQQYFPQPGDKPGVVEQKRKNRELVIDGMIRAAGGSYESPAVPAQAPAQAPLDLSSMPDADLEAIANGVQ